MTNSPECLQRPRNLMITYLDLHPAKSVEADLDPADVGIVGDPNHRGGYHCGKDRTVSNDYSVVQSSRDKNGLTLDASALDFGWFEWKNPKNGAIHNLRTFSKWAVAECERGASDTLDIREIIYSPDGKVVKRWDRLKRSSTGDNSHLSHTHFSFFRDAVKAGRDQSPLFRRYLENIGLLEGEEMISDEDAMKIATFKYGGKGILYDNTYFAAAEAASAHKSADAVSAKVDAIAAAIAQMPHVDGSALQAQLAEIQQSVSQVDEEVMAKIGNQDDPPEETAELLRAILGDRAEAVFRAGLAAPSAPQA